MSILYKVAISCDRCDEEQELHSDWRIPSKERWSLISVRGWRSHFVELDTEYGHVCPGCVKEIIAERRNEATATKAKGAPCTCSGNILSRAKP